MKFIKRLAVIGAVLSLLFNTGCASTKAERCENYEAVYTAYLATTTADIRPISKEEAAAAAVAAAFLRLHCGWVGTRGVDKNGVEIVVKP